MSTLTEQLVQLIQAKPISDDDLHRTLYFTLDALANAMAGRNTDQGRILLEWYETTGKSPRDQAMLIGALTHILETDDLHRASVVHPGCVVVPAVWAVGEQIRASGKEMLVAILKGFEAACRVGMAVGPAHYKIWHNTATCGPFGAAFGVGSLLGLSDEQLVHALGNAGSQSSGLWQFLETGAMTKHLHAGRAADAGVLSAQLAKLGFTGPPAILEGDKGFFSATCNDAMPDRLLADSSGPWQMHLNSIKPWPSCRHTHPAIDASLRLAQRHKGKNIEEIRIDTYQAAIDVCDRIAPNSIYEAKFSLQHCVAAALTFGGVNFDSFNESARNLCKPILPRINLMLDRDFQNNYPLNWGSGVTVKYENGDIDSEQAVNAKGDPENPLTDEELRTKSEMLIQFGMYNNADQKVKTIMKKLKSSNYFDFDLL